MHIGFITPEYPSVRKAEGGLGNYIRKTALELVQRGHRVTVFLLQIDQENQNDAGINLQFVKKFRFHWRLKHTSALGDWLELIEWWLNAQRMRQAVLSYHQQFPLDVVQSPNYKVLGYSLRHNKNFPLICRCSSYSAMLRAADGSPRNLPQVIADWAEAHLVQDADAAFAPSQFIAHTYERMEALRLEVIRTPLDLLHLEQDSTIYLQLLAGKKYILYFGTMNRVKGVDVLIDAAPYILSKYKDIHLLFLGRNDPFPGGSKPLEKIQCELADYWQEKRILYSPPLPKPQLYPIIRHAFGVVMPSRVDNYPNACLEALGLGVPVVGTYNSSLDEIIVDGKTGFLSANGDPDALCEAIDRLLSLTELERQQMCLEMKLEVSRISSEDRVGQLISFYESAINQSKCCRSIT